MLWGHGSVAFVARRVYGVVVLFLWGEGGSVFVVSLCAVSLWSSCGLLSPVVFGLPVVFSPCGLSVASLLRSFFSFFYSLIH